MDWILFDSRIQMVGILNGLVFGWSVSAEIDHSKTRNVHFSDVYCIYFAKGRLMM
jgi:hypothetical protein